MNCIVKNRLATFDAIKVSEDNLHEVAARMSSDEISARGTASKYLGLWLVFKPNQEIHICDDEQFIQFYEKVDFPRISEIVDVLKWAQQNLGKHTRPSPLDNLLARMKP